MSAFMKGSFESISLHMASPPFMISLVEVSSKEEFVSIAFSHGPNIHARADFEGQWPVIPDSMARSRIGCVFPSLSIMIRLILFLLRNPVTFLQ